MGIRDRPIAPRSPWQNGYVERAIGSIRRECLDHMIVWSEAHLRRILKEYTSYYNAARTHLGLQKDAPHRRPIERRGRMSPATSWADFTINTVGFSFRNGQVSWRLLPPTIYSTKQSQF